MKKYRVEAFIIPCNSADENDSNEIDDVKIANKLKELSFTSAEEEKNQKEEDENEKINIIMEDGKINLDTEGGSENINLNTKDKDDDDNDQSDLSGVFFEIDEHIYDEIIINDKQDKQEIKNDQINNIEYTKAIFKIEEPIYDEPYIGNFTRLNAKNSNNNYDVPQPRWALASSKYRRFGMVAPKLPKRSSSLKSIVEGNESFDDTLQEICCHGRKNGCLTNNERPEDISDDIFKENWMQKLNSLRKLETLLKDKEVALQSRERLLFKKEKELRILERLVKDKMKQAELYAKRYKKCLSAESILDHDRNLESRSSNGSKGQIKAEFSSNFILKANSKDSLDSNEDRIFKNPINSRTSLATDRLSSRVSSMRSRSRPRHKMRFDDLDSTLSADIGDSSFVITSKKFNPEIFKKPAAFARSASERRPRLQQQISTLRISSLVDNSECVEAMEEKTLKKINENIIASQNQESKFLNYGLIDDKTAINLKNVDKADFNNQKKMSYLNLESTNKTLKPKLSVRDRPISWNEDANDWLKKKREAYNLATKKTAVESVAEKENFTKEAESNKSAKVTKKKENNRKKFSIFR